jgi:hypothetical protein
MFALVDLINGNTLASLAESTRMSLQNMAAQVQTSWFKQHARDGSHTDVTATNVRTDHLSLAMNRDANKTGRVFIVDGTSAQGIPLDVAAGVQFISIVSPAGPATYSLYGIRQAGVQYGDLLFVRKDPRGQSTVVIQDRLAASVPVGTEIYVCADAAPSYPEFYLQEHGVWLPLIYSPGVGTNNVDGWAMFSTTSV